MSSSSTRSPSRDSTVCAPVDNAGTALLNSTIDALGEFLFCNYPVAGDCKYFANDGFFSSGSDKLCPDLEASSTAACAPVDNAGTALLNSTIDTLGESLFCNYPVAGECEYFANNGGFSSGSNQLCPEALSDSEKAATHTSRSVSTTRTRPGQPPPTAPGSSSILSSSPSSTETTTGPGQTSRSRTYVTRLGNGHYINVAYTRSEWHCAPGGLAVYNKERHIRQCDRWHLRHPGHLVHHYPNIYPVGQTTTTGPPAYKGTANAKQHHLAIFHGGQRQRRKYHPRAA
ncbi:hypothetical protein B0H14DRAFT_812011 [Mycena olivaceomarginata]|nr:hypothetical protein B0H14DRAFT_812011 [Mycena olivaceomarginata]